MINRSRYATTVTKNDAGGAAYELDSQHALAQFAFTGCFNSTCYANAELQLERLIALCDACESDFVAKTAIAAHEKGFMRDSAAALTAYIHARSPELLQKIFGRVCTDGKTLKSFAAIVKSGKLGRRGFGTKTRNIIREWLSARSDSQLLYDAIGSNKMMKCGTNGVSLEDIIRMCRPHPKTPGRSALFAWLRGAKFNGDKLTQEVRYKSGDGVFVNATREYAVECLPQKLRDWLRYKNDPKSFEEPPKVPLAMLTSLNLSKGDWETISRYLSWKELLKNLNTLSRHGVFESPRAVEHICRKLSNPEEIAKTNAFPYAILTAYLNAGPVPQGHGWTVNYWSVKQQEYDKKGGDSNLLSNEIRNALEIAMEESVKNSPTISGQVYLAIDTSGSMQYSITGDRGGYGRPPSSKVRCVDVAGLICAAILRKNPLARALPFSTKVHDIELNAMGSILSNAAKFTELGGGGTACSEPLRALNVLSAEGQTVIYISDYESHSDSSTAGGTAMMKEWRRFKDRNPKAKLICVDLTPRINHQIEEDPDILRIGGFSNYIFDMIAQFVKGDFGPNHWVDVIKSVQL